MLRPLRPTPLLAVVLALPALVTAQRATTPPAPVTSAPISDVRYEIRFDNATAVSRMLRVSMTFATPGNAPVLLSLPAWTPGAYEMSWFARSVSAFAPTAAGRPLRWDKADFDTWRIEPAGAKQITVRFDFTADQLDNAMSWARSDFALVNGTNVFLYPEGRGTEWPASVTVRTEAGWRVATGMTPAPAPGGGVTDSAATFSATSFHDLVDMPFFVGAFDFDSVKVGALWVRFASYPRGSVAATRRRQVWEQLTRILPPQQAIFGETPFSTYTVMQIADSSFAGASGLEHQNSHVDIISPYAIDSDFMPSLYAHEIFHAWNVKRLRPADLVPYRYDVPQPTTWLWMSEGVTDYYADLTLVRGGIVDSAGFLQAITAKVNEVESTVPVALEDASLSTWVKPTDGTAYLYYPKGALAGFLLDIMIRDASDNARSLDDVMRELYQSTYKRGRGFTSAEWWGAVGKAAKGRSFTDFHARYIDGREPYPWATTLPLAGMSFVSDTVREPRLGVFTQPDTGGVVVTSVEEGGAAAIAGVRHGDVLRLIGDIPVKDASFGEKFRAKYGRAADGSTLAVQVTRAGQQLTLNSTLRFVVRTQSRILFEARATPKAARIRAGILRGGAASR